MKLTADTAFGVNLPSVSQVTSLTGDFWYRFFQSPSEVNALNGAFQQEIRQFNRGVTEEAAVGGYTTCPKHHTETFYPVLVDPSKIKKTPLRYGDGYFYGGRDDVAVNGAMIFYGDVRTDRWLIPMPDSLRDISGASSGTYGLDLNWLSVGADAQVVTDAEGVWLQVSYNPTDTFELIVDQYGNERYLVWLYMAEFDYYWTSSHYGSLYSVNLPSTDAYVAANKAVLGAWTYGASELRLRELLAASVDEKVAEQGEVVEAILTDRQAPVVITDRRTIYGQPGATVTVAENQFLASGDFFFDTVKVTTFEDGAPDWLIEWNFPRELTGNSADETIPAGTYDLTATVVGDVTRISSNVGSVEFWDWVNADGSFAPILATQLGLNHPSSGPISPSIFPATFDVLDALARSPLGYIVSVSQIKSEFCVPAAATLLTLAREVTPPWLVHTTQFDGDPPTGWDSNDVQQRTVWL